MSASKEKRLAYTDRAKEIVGRLTLEEKVYLMSGNMSMKEMLDSALGEGSHYNFEPYPAGGNEKEGVAPMLFCDGPRGVVCGTGRSTCFPVTMCRGASFDAELEEEIGHAIGREVRAYGGNLFAGVCINLPYNPGWGRSQEVYGEESFALGRMGAALVRGVQAEHVMACVKHYAFNSMEISRFKVSVDCERRTEREVYLPHFKDCIDAGAASVMSAYNLYKGTHCGHSDYLLRKVLKEEWDFDGFVMSDFVWGVKNTVEAANGGQDMEMCITNFFGDKLVKAVQGGLVSEVRIDEAALRIVRTILAFEEAYEESGLAYGDEVIGCAAHRELALRMAREGIVLMQNSGGVLPFDKAEVKKVAVIGALANHANIGDHGSSRVFPAYVKTPLAGIEAMLPEGEVIYYSGEDIRHAKKLAREADAVVFVVGYSEDDEGEYVSVEGVESYTGSVGGDRKSLGLHEGDVKLLREVGPENANSAAVLIGGNMIMTTEWKDSVPAILMAFYPGQEGGTAIAEILFGEVNPGGKLPFVLPEREEELPAVKWETKNEYYDYYHGYTRLEKNGVRPLLPYGFGLSYTSFEVKDAEFSTDGATLKASCTLENTGQREGAEVVQMYVGFGNSEHDRPVKVLRGFARVSLEAGESRRVEIECPVEKLRYYAPAEAGFVLEHMDYEVYIGTSSSDADLLKGQVSL
jgi:beta-glucosidase